MVSTNLILYEPELSFIQQARGTELPSPFCNLLLTYLFSKEFLFYFISLSFIYRVRVHIYTILL